MTNMSNKSEVKQNKT